MAKPVTEARFLELILWRNLDRKWIHLLLSNRWSIILELCERLLEVVQQFALARAFVFVVVEFLEPAEPYRYALRLVWLLYFEPHLA